MDDSHGSGERPVLQVLRVQRQQLRRREQPQQNLQAAPDATTTPAGSSAGSLAVPQHPPQQFPQPCSLASVLGSGQQRPVLPPQVSGQGSRQLQQRLPCLPGAGGHRVGGVERYLRGKIKDSPMHEDSSPS